RTILDGDEALMGVMSLHQIEHGEMPYFFWGQRYGFSFLEVSSISLFTQLIGYGDLADKLGILLVWVLAIAGMFLFFEKRFDARWAFWLALLFALHPAWYHWSLKARGGYTTALLSSSWLFYLCTLKGNTWLRGSLIALLLVTTYYAQKLWFPSTCLLMLALLLENQSMKKVAFPLLVGGIVSVAAFYSMSLTQKNFWTPVLVNLDLFQENVLQIPERIEDMFEGNYFLGGTHPVKNWTYNSYSVLRGALIFAFILMLIRWSLIPNKKAQSLVFLSAIVPFGVLLIAEFNFGPRYLLPAPFFLLYWASEQWYAFRYQRLFHFAFPIMALIFLVGSIQLKDTGHYARLRKDRWDMLMLVERLEKEKYSSVLIENPGLHWQ